MCSEHEKQRVREMGVVDPKPSEFTAPPPPIPRPAAGTEAIRAEYVRKLISLLGTNGIDNDALMARIEGLLAREPVGNHDVSLMT
jgi:hypothetical protein